MELFVLAIHVTCISATFLLVLYSDILALEWLLGARETLPRGQVRALHRGVGAGFFLIIASGISLSMPIIGGLLQDPVFYVKMAFVLALIVNALSMNRLLDHALAHPFREVPRSKRWWFYLSGAASTFGWLGAALCGLLLVR